MRQSAQLIIAAFVSLSACTHTPVTEHPPSSTPKSQRTLSEHQRLSALIFQHYAYTPLNEKNWRLRFKDNQRALLQQTTTQQVSTVYSARYTTSTPLSQQELSRKSFEWVRKHLKLRSSHIVFQEHTETTLSTYHCLLDTLHAHKKNFRYAFTLICPETTTPKSVILVSFSIETPTPIHDDQPLKKRAMTLFNTFQLFAT